ARDLLDRPARARHRGAGPHPGGQLLHPARARVLARPIQAPHPCRHHRSDGAPLPASGARVERQRSGRLLHQLEPILRRRRPRAQAAAPDSFGDQTVTRLRPPRLEAYRASSVALNRLSQVWPAAGQVATPSEQVTRSGPSSLGNTVCSSSLRIRSANSSAPRASVSSHTLTNSSPPKRPTTSVSRLARLSTAANPRMTTSPTSCP